MYRYHEFTPAPAFQETVERYWTLEVLQDHPHIVVPDPCVDLILFWRGRELEAASVFGTMTKPRWVTLHAGQFLCGVRFLPGMFSASLPAVVPDLTNRVVALDTSESKKRATAVALFLVALFFRLAFLPSLLLLAFACSLNGLPFGSAAPFATRCSWYNACMETSQKTVPQIIVIAGPNGAGKSTLAATYIPPSVPFLNADEIAKGLTAEETPNKDVMAGRIMLRQLDELEAQSASFAVETTLASRSLAPRITRLQASGYRFRLIYVWVPNADLSVQRVAERVRRGGHHIPEDVIRRRYEAGLRNFFQIYAPLADKWALFNNSVLGRPQVVARGLKQMRDPNLWMRLYEENRR